MAWVAVDKDGTEAIFDECPRRIENSEAWGFVFLDDGRNIIELSKGSIKKLIGRDLTWEDEPVELKEA